MLIVEHYHFHMLAKNPYQHIAQTECLQHLYQSGLSSKSCIAGLHILVTESSTSGKCFLNCILSAWKANMGKCCFHSFPVNNITFTSAFRVDDPNSLPSLKKQLSDIIRKNMIHTFWSGVFFVGKTVLHILIPLSYCCSLPGICYTVLH